MINKKTGTSAPIIHSPGMSNPDYDDTNECWGFFCRVAEKANSKSPSDTEIVVCNNMEEPVAEKCLNSMGLKYTALGKDIKNWDNILKIQLVLDHISKCEAEQILYFDSRDVVVVGDISHCDDILDRRQCSMLFNAETKFYPKCPSLKGTEMFERQRSPNEYFALNAGCWIGKTEFLKDALEDALDMDLSRHLSENKGAIEEYRIIKSDQLRWHLLYERLHPKIKVDHRCEMFQNIYLHKRSDFFFRLL
jgi:hypothetical protein